MTEQEQSHQVLEGLKQLKMNLDLYKNYTIAKGQHLDDPMVKNTIDIMKAQFATTSLEVLND